MSNPIIKNKKANLPLISKSLILAVLKNRPQILFAYLITRNIKTSFPNKINFYSFFKTALLSAHQTSKGALYLEIEKPNWEKEDYLHYNFYDKVHKFDRLSIKVKESNNIIYFDILPF